jgi:hypothetical protein
MKTLTKIPSHYRRLAAHEVIRKGDLKFRYGQVVRVSNSIGKKAGDCNSPAFRRQHVSVKLGNHLAKLNIKTVVRQPVKKAVHPVEKAPLVTFSYPRSQTPWVKSKRAVRLIAANDRYMVGIEILENNRFHFKKFLRSKMEMVSLVEFNPTAI